ncbi:MAG: hypothetical protein J6S85_00020 [Methanobrevibacter sp.]|nr:hypothetical protein [Methanobrevibacter sp.]
MIEGYLLKFNGSDFVFSSSDLYEMDEFVKHLNNHLIGDKDKLHTIVITPLFSPDRKAPK